MQKRCKDCGHRFTKEKVIDDDVGDESYYVCPKCNSDRYEDDWDAEIEKCKSNPYYFATTYLNINGKPFTTRLNEEEFNRQITTNMGSHFRSSRYGKYVYKTILKHIR